MKVLNKIKTKDLLFIDIETVRVVKDLELDTPLFDSWQYKVQYELKNASNEEIIASYKDKAALHPEFAKIACVTLGYAKGNQLVLKTYNNEDEKALLEELMEDLHKFSDRNKDVRLAGHYIIYFDIPFVMKRCLVNQVHPHDLFDLSEDKPWTAKHIDTKPLWQGTSPNAASLINIAVALSLPSPKDDISGSQVGDVYYGEIEGGIERISKYCEKDVLTVANVIQKMKFEEIFEPVSSLSSEDNTVSDLPIVRQLFDGARYTATHKKKLVAAIKELDDSEKEKAYKILGAVISKAKGSVTKFTTDDLKELKELCQ